MSFRLCRWICILVILASVTACRRETPHSGLLRPCDIGNSKALCGTVEVFENRQTRAGRKLGLKVIVLPAQAGKPQPDAVFLIPGGPGAGITGSAEAQAKIFGSYLRERDLVLVDPRGTGGSNALNCSLAPSGRLQQRFETLVETARRCLPELSARADLTQYNTEYIADDLDDVRGALGYERINLQGLSYGTRVAQVYARRHAEHVRVLIMEGVYPVWIHLPLGVSRTSQASLDAVLKLCAADADCHRHYPNASQELAQIERRLEQGPVTVTVSNSATKRDEQVQLDHAMAAQAIRFMLYNARSANQIPRLIHTTAEGNWRPLAEQALGRTINASWYSFGVWLSVTCTEDVRWIRPEEIDSDTADTFFGPFRLRDQKAACDLWPKGEVSRGFGERVQSTAPALLVTGELDPMTPPRFASAVAEGLPNGRTLVLPGYGHELEGMIGDDCVDKIETQFLRQGSAQNLDTSCVANIRRRPFAF